MKRILAALLALIMVLTCVTAGAESVKKERVFAVVNAAGEAQTIIDNVQLNNPDALETLVDRTALTAIENVSGHETFKLEGDVLTWNAKGQPIRYQGNGTTPLPVTPVVTFEADGKVLTAVEAVQFSGALTITVTYAAQTNVPMLAVSVLSVPSGMSNITLENAMLLDEGSQQLIVGYAVPGADEALALPASFTIRCDADHADIKNMMTIATSDPLALLCDKVSDKVADADTLVTDLVTILNALNDGTEMPEFEGDLNEIASGLAALLTGVDALADGADQLNTGASSLATGAAALDEGAATLATGAASLDEGAAALETGLTTLIGSNEALNNGAAQLFAAILATANQQLSASGLDAAGITLPELTAENYAAVLDGAVQQLNAMIDQGKVGAEAQVRTAVMEQEAVIREGVAQIVRGKVLTEVLKTVGLEMTAEDYAAAAKAGKIPAEQATQIDAAVNAQMETDEIKATMDAAITGKIDELVAENLSSEAVQAQMAEAVAPAQAAISSLSSLKEQLDQVNTFVTGLKTYTDGVSQVQAGSVTLHTGTTQLSTGALDLSTGAATLSKGASDLSTGASTLADGAGQLKTGMHSAVTRASDKALPYLTGDVRKVIDAFNHTKDAVAGEHGYDLVADDMTAETVYIIRTDMK